MSLDVYLTTENTVKKTGTGVFIRDNGSNKELTIEEVKAKWPDSTIEDTIVETNEVFSYNVTHNLGQMAVEAGVYEALWRPYRLVDRYTPFSRDEYQLESDFEAATEIKAKMLIDPLREGLHKLKSNPERFKKFNPENGWGCYEGLVDFVEQYLEACYNYPDTVVRVSR